MATVYVSLRKRVQYGLCFLCFGHRRFAAEFICSEMLSQVYVAEEDTGKKISNMVMMGSGEPLDNYENDWVFRVGIG